MRPPIRIRVLLAIAALALAATPASALPVPFAVSIQASGSPLGLKDLSVEYTPGAGGGTYTLLADEDLGIGVLQDWSSMYDMDPFVTNNFVILNNTLVTQNYSVTVTSPVSPALGSTLMLGSVGLTLTNNAGTSASLTNVGTNAVYTALIDGNPVATLFGNPYSLPCGPTPCSDTDSTDFGIPVPVAGPGVTTSMGIRIEFALSPGDSGGVTSVFNVDLPEPASLTLIALGGLGLALVRLLRPS